MILFVFALLVTLHAADFPDDYESSRARFRAGCAERRRSPRDFCRSYPIPSRQFDDLSVDVAYFARGGRRLLVMQSGTHGPEAYAGAAIQERTTRDHLERLLARGIDVLLIHALNPYGYKVGRRVDENNVNLNRNFVDRDADYHRANEGYRKLRWAFEPVERVTNVLFEYFKTDRRLLWQLALDRFSKRPISEAMNMGQYESERGLNFGGSGPTPQVDLLKRLLTPIMAPYEKILFVDWHTGLGAKGTLHWMAGEASTPALIEELKPLLKRLEPRGIKTTIVAEDPDFFRTTGGVEVFAAKLAPPGAAVIGATAEFGTLGAGTIDQLRSAHRMIVENQAWFNGCADRAVEARVRRDFAELFNPTDPDWRDGVLRQADYFLSGIASDFGVDGRSSK